ncbi:Fc.00g094560.m01.CDS01 [Cosmosporella sp. VM-42]
MPRKGNQKVKTGCITCKVRKVKCDETWPQCMRCKKTGRTCAGYRPPPTGSFSWDVLLRSGPSLSPTTDGNEMRSLCYFHQAVAPALSGPFDSSFWTHLVAQLTHQEPAAKHAVLAISSLFESFSPVDCPATENQFALSHYNQAINHLTTAGIQDVDKVLVICALFVCIEFLRGDHQAAIDHVQAGIRILNTSRKGSSLAAVFSQASIFPLLLKGTVSAVPRMQDVPRILVDVPDTFQTVTEAQYTIDLLASQAFHLVQDEGRYRLDHAEEEDFSPSLWSEQSRLVKALEDWGVAFAKLIAPLDHVDDQHIAILLLQMRADSCKIWTRKCLERSELCYDGLEAEFESLVEMAREALSVFQLMRHRRPKFIFDNGFTPVLQFVAIKCRTMKIRITALSLMNELSYPRESLWDVNALYDAAKRIIELEHDIDLTPEKIEALKDDDREYPLPPDKKRIKQL